jgi:uracil-DNA glycosylase
LKRDDDNPFAELVLSVQGCRLCEASLPMGPRPVFQIDPQARILIAGQAPGRRVHETGVIPLPHPSPRNNIWKKNPWFVENLLPALRQSVSDALA